MAAFRLVCFLWQCLVFRTAAAAAAFFGDLCCIFCVYFFRLRLGIFLEVCFDVRCLTCDVMINGRCPWTPSATCRCRRCFLACGPTARARPWTRRYVWHSFYFGSAYVQRRHSWFIFACKAIASRSTMSRQVIPFSCVCWYTSIPFLSRSFISVE